MFSGERLRELRKEKGLNREALAEILQIRPRTVTFYETNDRSPSIEKAYEIAEYFEVSLDYLFNRTNCRTVKRE